MIASTSPDDCKPLHLVPCPVPCHSALTGGAERLVDRVDGVWLQIALLIKPESQRRDFLPFPVHLDPGVHNVDTGGEFTAYFRWRNARQQSASTGFWLSG